MMYARSCGSPSCSKWWFYCHRVTIIYLWEVVQQYLWLSDYFSKCCDFWLIFGYGYFGSVSCDFIASYVDMLLTCVAVVWSAGCVSPRLRPLVPPPSDLSWEQFSEPTFLYLTETPTTTTNSLYWLPRSQRCVRRFTSPLSFIWILKSGPFEQRGGLKAIGGNHSCVWGVSPSNLLWKCRGWEQLCFDDEAWLGHILKF